MYFSPFPEPTSQSRIKLNKINWKRVPPVQLSVSASAFRDVDGKRTLHDLISLLLQCEHSRFDVWSFESFDFQTVRFTFPRNWRLIRFVRLTYNARVAVFNPRPGENMNAGKNRSEESNVSVGRKREFRSLQSMKWAPMAAMNAQVFSGRFILYTCHKMNQVCCLCDARSRPLTMCHSNLKVGRIHSHTHNYVAAIID